MVRLVSWRARSTAPLALCLLQLEFRNLLDYQLRVCFVRLIQQFILLIFDSNLTGGCLYLVCRRAIAAASCWAFLILELWASYSSSHNFNTTVNLRRWGGPSSLLVMYWCWIWNIHNRLHSFYKNAFDRVIILTLLYLANSLTKHIGVLFFKLLGFTITLMSPMPGSALLPSEEWRQIKNDITDYHDYKERLKSHINDLLRSENLPKPLFMTN